MSRLGLMWVGTATLLLGSCGDGGDSVPNAVPTHDLEALNDLLSTGILRVHERCFYFESPVGAVGLRFPEGFNRLPHSSGIRDGDGVLVARVGADVDVGGPWDEFRDPPCDIGREHVASILVSEIGPAEHID